MLRIYLFVIPIAPTARFYIYIFTNKDTCTHYGKFTELTDYCTEDYAAENHESEQFGFGWSRYNATYSPPHGFDPIYKAFQHRSAASLGGLPIMGVYDTYTPSGYVYELRGLLSHVRANLSLLQEMQWIDRQTRAVLVEFATFNPNINLVMVTTILVEFLASGNVLAHPRFDTLNLFGDIHASNSVSALKIACGLIFMGFIVFYMVRECRTLVRMGVKAYASQFWSWIEWAIIVCAWTSLAMFLHRLYTAYEVLDFFRETHGYGYMNMQQVSKGSCF